MNSIKKVKVGWNAPKKVKVFTRGLFHSVPFYGSSFRVVHFSEWNGTLLLFRSRVNGAYVYRILAQVENG